MDNQFFSIYDLPEDQEEAAWGIIRRFWWNPSVVEQSDEIWLYSGDQLVARFATMAEMRAFVSGMATVHLATPPEVVAELTRVLGVEPDWDDTPEWWRGRDLP